MNMVADSVTGLGIVHPFTVLIRILCALVAGFIIGFERERNYQPAGLRTHMVLSLGACTVMILSYFIPYAYSPQNADPARLSAQVISGIGFLGAGAIFKYGFNIKGLTTAATIWTTSGIGMVFGAGFYFLGVIATLFLVITLQLFEKVEMWLVEQKKVRILQVMYYSDAITGKEILTAIKKHTGDIDVRQVSVTEDVENKTSDFVVNCRIDEDFSLRLLFDEIKQLGHIKKIKID